MYSRTFWILVLVVCTDALKEGDPGVCVDRNNKTITKTYQVMVPCKEGEKSGSGKGECPEIREKPEIQVIEDLVCCSMYNWDDENDVCVPECEYGCINGKCVAPNQCVCTPPMVLHNKTAPNICGPPVCDQPCNNGTCTSNNRCTCNDGFTPIDLYTCVPHCINCDHGKCISPNVCKCHEGFTEKEGRCTPQCEGGCNNGYCSAPNNCTCNDGYKLEDDKCQPICKKSCLNGDCIAPESCQCKKDFEAKNGHNEICIPKCNKDCKNGCSIPNVCDCDLGYTLKNDKCEPVCEKACVNGSCSAPNICTCKTGYTKDTSDPSVCFKYCGPCIHGTCKDGKCICDADMDLVNGTCVVSTPGSPEMSSGVTATTGVASIQMTWLVGGAVLLLLIVLVLVVISRLYLRKQPEKTPDGPYQASVAFTRPNTLYRTPQHIEEEETNDTLLDEGTNVV